MGDVRKLMLLPVSPVVFSNGLMVLGTILQRLEYLERSNPEDLVSGSA